MRYAQRKVKILGWWVAAVLACLGVSLVVAASGDADESADVSAVPLLDELKRTESPLSAAGSWAPLQWTTGTRPGAVSQDGWHAVDAYPTINGAYWTGTQFSGEGTGDAASVTMQVGPGSQSRYVALWLNMPDPAKAKTGYQLSWTVEAETSKYQLALSRWTAGSKTLLSSKASMPIANGTTLALSYNDGAITAWSGSGQTLEAALSASDTTYPSGYLGMEASGYISRSTGFRGGELAEPPQGECPSGMRLYGGECWKEEVSLTKVTAPQAAAACGDEGGFLPSALALVGFANEPGIFLSKEGEWADDVPSISGVNLYAVTTVNTAGEVGYELSTKTRPYRCVYPFTP
jgi:hypothetical protein